MELHCSAKEKWGGGGGGEKKSCWDEVLHESVPGSRPAL